MPSTALLALPVIFMTNLIATLQVHAVSEVFPRSNVTCDRFPTRVITKYRGWPFTLSCGDLDEIIVDYPDYGSLASCLIRDVITNDVIINETMAFEDLYSSEGDVRNDASNASVDFEVTITADSRCWSQHLHINLTDLPNRTCQSASTIVAHTTVNEAFLDQTLNLPCKAPVDDQRPRLHTGTYTANFNVTWMWNCSTLPSGVEMMSDNTLKVNQFAYGHPGIYTCAVTNNGQTLYVSHFKVCAKPKFLNRRPLIQCSSKTVKAKIGDPATLECVANLGYGSTRPMLYTTYWTKVSIKKNVCTVHGISQEKSISNVTCNNSVTEPPCFLHVPSEEERKLNSTLLTLRLFIRKVESDDFGEYKVNLNPGSRSYGVWATVDLIQNDDQHLRILQAQTIAIGASAVFPRSNITCDRFPTRVITKYRGWPFTLSCGDLDELIVDYPDYESLASCLIRDVITNDVIINETMAFEDLYLSEGDVRNDESNASVDFEVTITADSRCWSQHLHINLTDLPNRTCQSASTIVAHTTVNEAFLDQTLNLPCKAPVDDQRPRLHTGTYTANFSVTWMWNCSTLPSGVEMMSDNTLNVNQFAYEHPGIYTCAVTNNGQTLYVSHFKVCAKPKFLTRPPLIQCSSKTVKAKIGDPATLECVANLGDGSTRSMLYTTFWTKVSIKKNVCTVHGTSQEKSISNVTCNNSVTEPPCFLHVPSEEERKLNSTLLTLRLFIRKVESDDFGEYKVNLNPGSRSYAVWATVDLIQNDDQHLRILQAQTIAIGASAGVAGLLLILVSAYCVWRTRKKSSGKAKQTTGQSSEISGSHESQT